MKHLLLHLDTSPDPSVFDRVVALDAAADDVMSYGGVTPDTVRDLVHGAIFTRGPKDLHNTAIFIGGTEVAAGERLLASVITIFFGPMRVSVMLDSNGSNTTAAAAVAKLQQAAQTLDGRRAVVIGASGPVGMRAAGLLARAGAQVTVTSRQGNDGTLAARIAGKYGGHIDQAVLRDASDAQGVLQGAELILNAGPPGVCVVPRNAWSGQNHLRAIADLNAVPPLGIEGIEVTDNGGVRGSATVFGALGVGGLKMKIHKACLVRLFERNDLVLDAEAIADMAHGLTGKSS